MGTTVHVCLLHTSMHAHISVIVCECVSKHACGKDKNERTHIITHIHSDSMHEDRCISVCVCLRVRTCT